METLIVKSNRALELPTKLAKKYGIRRGTKIFFVEERDHVKMFPITEEVIDRNAGFMNTGGKLLKALNKEKETEKKR